MQTRRCNALRRRGKILRQARGEYRLLMLRSVRSACLSLGYRFLTVVVMPIDVIIPQNSFYSKSFCNKTDFLVGFRHISRLRCAVSSLLWLIIAAIFVFGKKNLHYLIFYARFGRRLRTLRS